MRKQGQCHLLLLIQQTSGDAALFEEGGLGGKGLGRPLHRGLVHGGHCGVIVIIGIAIIVIIGGRAAARRPKVPGEREDLPLHLGQLVLHGPLDGRHVVPEQRHAQLEGRGRRRSLLLVGLVLVVVVVVFSHAVGVVVTKMTVGVAVVLFGRGEGAAADDGLVDLGRLEGLGGSALHGLAGLEEAGLHLLLLLLLRRGGRWFRHGWIINCLGRYHHA